MEVYKTVLMWSIVWENVIDLNLVANKTVHFVTHTREVFAAEREQ